MSTVSWRRKPRARNKSVFYYDNRHREWPSRYLKARASMNNILLLHRCPSRGILKIRIRGCLPSAVSRRSSASTPLALLFFGDSSATIHGKIRPADILGGIVEAKAYIWPKGIAHRQQAAASQRHIRAAATAGIVAFTRRRKNVTCMRPIYAKRNSAARRAST